MSGYTSKKSLFLVERIKDNAIILREYQATYLECCCCTRAERFSNESNTADYNNSYCTVMVKNSIDFECFDRNYG